MTQKEKDFIKQYIIDFNGTQAAIRSGYSKKTARQIATENLSKPYIQIAVKKEIEKRNERLEVSQDRVVMELIKIAFSDISNYLDENGKLDISKIDDNITPVISTYEVTENTTTSKKGNEYNQKNIKFRLYDKMRALELLGKHLAMFTDKIDQTVQEKSDVKVSFE